MRLAVLVGVVLMAVLVAGPSAQKRTFTLPPETAAYAASDLPGYQLVQRNCLGCHSAHYAAMQPPSSSRTYWDATVKKMKKPFGAPFPDEDIGAMVDYLVKTYGAERTTTPASGRGARRDLPPKGGSHAMLSWDSWLPASAGRSGRR